MDEWKGKVVIVTGVSSGIGRAIAVALLKRGVHVAGLSRRLDMMNDIKIEGKEVGKFLPIQCDLTNKSDLKNAFETILKSLGAPDALINNAGVCKMSELASTEVEDARAIFETNVLAVIALTKEALPHMNPEGIIININSIAGHGSDPLMGYGAYTGSKRALLGVTQTLRSELSLRGSQIRITSISPGAVMTDMMGSATEKLGDFNLQILEAEDIAECVIFVLSLPSRVNVAELIVEPRDYSKIKILTKFGQKMMQ